MREKFYIDAKVKKIDKQIEKAIKKAGITYPHHSLAFFKATYAKFEEPNGNKVILANSVKDDVKYLIGTQMNYNHERYGAIMGSIINAYVTKNDEIEIVFTFAKTVYPKEYELALELMKNDELTVSFELMVDKDDVEYVSGGNRKLKKVYFDGVGLLFKVKPAYKLVYANAKDITKKWTRIGELIEKALTEKEEGEAKMDEKAREALLAKFKEAVTKELGEEAVKDWSNEQWEAELQKRAEAEEKTKSETTEASEGEAEESEDTNEEKATDENVEDSKEENTENAEDSSEEETEKSEDSEDQKEKASDNDSKKSEEAKTVIETKKKETYDYDDEKQEEKIEVEKETTVTKDGEEKMKEKVKRETVYTYAQVEEIKAEYEAKLAKQDKEIAFLKENAKKVVEIRNEYGEFVKDLSDEELFDETKMKIAKLEKENAELKKEKSLETAEDKSDAEEDKAEEKPEDKEDLKTGHEEKEQREEETADDRISQYLKNKYGQK